MMNFKLHNKLLCLVSYILLIQINSLKVETSDSKTILNCDFESLTLCNWINNINLKDKFTINDPSNRLTKSPFYDHTKNNFRGHYIYIQNTDNQNDQIIRGSIESASYSESSFGYHKCFSLWFYMNTNNFESKIQIFINYQNGTKQIVETRVGNYGEKWHYISTNLFIGQKSFVIEIWAEVRSGFIAIDDLKLSPNDCSIDNEYMCSFEEKNECGLFEINSKKDWSVLSSNSNNISIASVDHTTGTLNGHMYGIDFGRKGHLFSTTLTATTKYFKATKQSCVTFWYYMRGLPNDETLTIKLVKISDTMSKISKVWSASGEQGPYWFAQRFTVFPDGLQWRLQFIAQGTNKGVIALDDLNVEIDQICPLKGKCDFEDDSCLWQNLMPLSYKVGKNQTIPVQLNQDIKTETLLNPDFIWSPHSPHHNLFSVQWPEVDHTIATSDGTYLLLDTTDITYNRKAVFMSPIFDFLNSKKEMCLSFAYYIPKSSNSLYPLKIEVYQSENYKKVKNIGIYNKTTNNSWAMAYISIKPDNKLSMGMRFFIIGYSSNILYSTSAIDDIAIDTQNPCVTQNSMFSCSATQQIPINKVCDFVKDCNNGIDEHNCGDCDFENSNSCGYIENHLNSENKTSNDVYKWFIGNINFQKRPKIEGAVTKNGYAFAAQLEGSKALMGDIADLVSPKINSIHSTCIMNFFYTFKGNPTLSVVLLIDGQEEVEVWDRVIIDNIGQTSKNWQLVTVYLRRMKTAFKVIFRSEVGTTHDNYVAIDDIKFTSCGPPLVNPNQECPNDMFLCKNNVCITKDGVCDHTDDCGDGTDENNCQSYQHQCNFEDGFCEWSPHSVENNVWSITSGQKRLSIGPTFDHTKGLKNGHYLYLAAKNDTFKNEYQFPESLSTLSSIFFQPNKLCAMRFYYDMEGDGFISLKISARLWSSGKLIKFAEYNNPFNVFSFIREKTWFSSVNESFQVVITGKVRNVPDSNMNTYITLDDISFTTECVIQTMPTPLWPPIEPTQNTRKKCDFNQFQCLFDPLDCIPVTQVCDFIYQCGDKSDEQNCGNCDFNNNSMCGWKPTGEGKLNLTLKRASDLTSLATIPHEDADGNLNGGFLILDFKNTAQYDLPAVIESPVFGQTSPVCKLQFSYHHQNCKGYISVQIYQFIGFSWSFVSKPFYDEYLTGNLWKTAIVPIGGVSDRHRIRIIAETHNQNNEYQDIEIDNTKFVDCDPNKVYNIPLNCTFELDMCGWYNINFDNSSQLSWQRTNALNLEAGKVRIIGKNKYFLYVKRNLALNGDNTAKLISVQQKGFEGQKCLSFRYYMFGSDNSKLELQMSKNGDKYKTIWVQSIESQLQSNNWMQAFVNIEIIEQKVDKFNLMFAAILQPLSNDIVSLDDFSLSEGPCHPRDICDFETNSFCGWTTDGFGLRSGQSNKEPFVDHTLGTNGGKYAFTNRIGNSTLISPQIQLQTIHQMCVKFWYYISNQSSLLLEVHRYFDRSNQSYHSITSNRFNKNHWNYGHITIQVNPYDQVIFEGSINTMVSVVAIDDILIEDHSCQPPGSCDFEEDICGYHNKLSSGQNTSLWVRNSASALVSIIGPHFDHTTGQETGWYVFLSASDIRKSTAILESEEIQMSGTVCVRFYYLMQTKYPDPRVFTILTIDITDENGNTQNIGKLQKLMSSWTLFERTMRGMPQKYIISFTAFKDTEAIVDFAIDDIQITNIDCNFVPIPSTIKPIITTIKPQIQKQWDCNFDNDNTCSWTLSNPHDWTLLYKPIQNRGPVRDHTKSSLTSRYLIFLPQNTSQSPTTGQIISSIPISTDNEPHCLQFWYYMETMGPSKIQVNLLINESHDIQPGEILNQIGNHGKQWNLAQVQMPQYRNVKMSISVYVVNINLTNIAFDDIKVTPGVCPLVTQSVCDLETIDNKNNFCGYRIERDPSLSEIGTRESRFLYSGVGPMSDHTTNLAMGHYFVVTAPFSSDYIKHTIRLVIPKLNSTGLSARCLKFWYQTYGQNVLSFSINYRSVNAFDEYNIWSSASNAHNQWTGQMVTVRVNFYHDIIFKIVVQKGDNSFVSLDDISLIEGQCSTTKNCGFEIDDCMFTNRNIDNNSNLEWERYTGPLNDISFKGPLVDHTTNTSTGSYEYLSSFNLVKMQTYYGAIESPPIAVTANQGFCVSFWFYIVNNQSVLEVSLIKYSSSKLTIDSRVLGTNTIDTNSSWVNGKYNISASFLQNTNEIAVLFRGIFSNGLKNIIALDDIILTEGYCTSDSRLINDGIYCSSTASVIDNSKVCDFVIDCPLTLDDEKNCGSCDFETDWCNWSNANYPNIDKWIRRQASNTTIPGPVFDNTTRTANGWYLTMYSDRNIKRFGTISSNTGKYIFKKSSFKCIMRFAYHNSYANIEGVLRVELKTKYGNKWSTRWYQIQKTDQGWSNAIVYIGEMKTSFVVEIDGYATSNRIFDVSIDDIKFENCGPPELSNRNCTHDEIDCGNKNICIRKNYVCDSVDDCGNNWDEDISLCRSEKSKSCSFEQDYCQWSINSSISGQKWRFRTTSDKRTNYDTGPLNDHTYANDDKGHYLVLNGIKSVNNVKSWLTSPPLVAKIGQICSLRFFYYLYGNEDQMGTIKVYTKFKTGSNGNLVYEKGGNVGQFWDRAVVEVNSSLPFSFVIEGIAGIDINGDIAIDDASFSPGCEFYDQTLPTSLPTHPTADPCRIDQYKCANGDCIQSNLFCDLTKDCSDGSDEMTCGTCSFENGTTCGWTDQSSGKFKWSLVISRKYNDHTTQSNKGHYLAVKNDSGIITSNSKLSLITLISPLLRNISTQCEFNFWYRINSSRKGLSEQKTAFSFIEIDFDSININKFLKLQTLNNTNGIWNKATVYLPYGNLKSNSIIKLKAYLLDRSDDISIDDLSFRNCDRKRLLADCNFENADENNGFCHWKVDNRNGYALWHRGQGFPFKTKSGPSADHTTGYGHYIFMDQSEYKQTGLQAVLNSPIMTSTQLTGGACLSFWYHMFGANIGILKVMTSSADNNTGLQRQEWFKYSSQGDEWIRADISINVFYDFIISIVAMTEIGPQGVIAIDDISYNMGLCKHSTLCTFETDTCGWTPKSTGDSVWKWTNTIDSTKQPIYDHTRMSSDGHFMNLVPVMAYDVVSLMSPVFSYTGKRCLLFWYNMYGDNVGTLDVYQRTGDERRLEDRVSLLKRNTSVLDNGKIWRRAKVTLSSLDNYFIALEVTTGSNMNGHIAVDDIEIENGECRNVVDCNFESDKCGWSSNVELTRIDWVRRSGVNANLCFGPTKDHTFFTEKGHYMYACYTGQPEGLLAAITSEDFNSGIDRCLGFWLKFINGNDLVLTIIYGPIHSQINWKQIREKSNEGLKDYTDWIYFETNIPSLNDNNFEFITLVVTSLSTRGNQTIGLAIDDIKLMPYPCGHPLTTPTPLISPFPPQPTFAPTHYDCNFESDLCLWDILKGNLTWNRVQGHRPNMTDRSPSTDHTLLSTRGHYLLFQNKANSTIANEDNTYYELNSIFAILKSKNVIELNDVDLKGFCIKFWYIIDGTSNGWLNVSLRSADNPALPDIHYFHDEGTYGPNWKYNQVYIRDLQTASYIILTGYTGSNGVLALDDITLNFGHCLPQDYCDFTFSSCGWDNDLSLPIQWKLGSGIEGIGPKIDHTTEQIYGKYLYINAKSSSINAGQKGALISPVYSPTKKCIQFWFYFFGRNVGALNVYLKYGLSKEVYLLRTEMGSDINGWKLIQIPIINHKYDSPFQYIIEVTKGSNSNNSKIAIDDIKVQDSCQPMGSCDFELDFCSYTNNRTTSSWGRAMGQISIYGPTKDHTLGDEFGVYSYINKGEKSILTSPYLTFQSIVCVSFWYYRNGTKFPTLSLVLREYSEQNTSDLLTNIVKYDQQSNGGQWLFSQYTLNKPGIKFRLSFIAQLDQNNEQFLAIDDINLKQGICPYIEDISHTNMKKSFNCMKSNQYIYQNQVCDFNSNCINGRDEQMCGFWCDFEGNDTCNWTINNMTSTLIVTDLSKGKSIPTRDHTKKSDFNGKYLKLFNISGQFDKIPEAQLISPVIRNSSPFCKFNFHYFMSDPLDKTAVLSVKLWPFNTGRPSEIFRVEGDMGQEWVKGQAVIGRIAHDFQIIIDVKLNVNKGKGVIALDDIEFLKQDCAMPIPSYSSPHINDTINYFVCNDRSTFISIKQVCDFQGDCSDFSDEIDAYAHCDSAPGRCNFEEGICDWDDTDVKSSNKWKWSSAKAFSSYFYAPKRDHTLNTQFGHYLYLWNQNNSKARIESPFMEKKDKNCEFRFYYTYNTKYLHTRYSEIENIGNLTVYVRFQFGGTLYKLWSKSQPHGMYFERKAIDLSQIEVPFSVVIEAIAGKDKYGVWSIDDVSFSRGCSSHTNTITNTTYTPFPVITQSIFTCPPNRFLCDLFLNEGVDYKCIDKNKVCDFITDCKDGSDESKCGINSFKTGWKDISEGHLYWKINGSLYVTKRSDGISDRAVIQSTKFGSSGSKCEISFSYYIDSKFNFGTSLQLMLNWNATESAAQLWTTTSNTNKTWKYHIQSIGEQKNGWFLQFIGQKEINDSLNYTLAIKDLSFISCAEPNKSQMICVDRYWLCNNNVCIDNNNICDFNDDCGDASDETHTICAKYVDRCTFERSALSKQQFIVTSCGWHDDNNQWLLYSGRDTKDFMGPGVDHTSANDLGHFLMVSSAELKSPGSQALLVSPVLLADGTSDCNLRFWWTARKGSGLLSVNKRYYGSHKLNELINIEADSNADVWQKISVNLMSELDFEVVIIATKGNNTQSSAFFALDDISLTPKCKLKNKISPTLLPPTIKPNGICNQKTQFQCTDNNCIPIEEKCDFRIDCPNGSDESSCPKACNFESNMNGLCYWNIDTDNINPKQILWTQEYPESASQKTKFYPPTDNTLKTKFGHFLFIYPTNSSQPIDNFEFNLYSPVFSSSAPNCVFNASYYTPQNSGKAIYTLSIISEEIGEQMMWSFDTSNGDYQGFWQNVSFGIGRRKKPFAIQLSRQTSKIMTETLAIDDIIFSGCEFSQNNQMSNCTADRFLCRQTQACIDKNKICDLTDDCKDGSDEECKSTSNTLISFESTDLKGFRFGKPKVEADFQWKIINGSDPQRKQFKTGPAFDHTLFNLSGNYLYMNYLMDKGFNLKAWFISPVIKATDGLCRMRFFYYMFGENVNTLSVYQRNYINGYLNAIKVYTQVNKDYWVRSDVNFTGDKNFQIIIEGRTGGSEADSIAIDDISFESNCHFLSDSLPQMPTTTPKSVSTVTIPSSTHNCSRGFYYCFPDSRCVPLITICNFVVDCSDASDESLKLCTQLKCDFKAGEQKCGLSIINVPKNQSLESIDSKGSYKWKIGRKYDSSGSPNFAIIPDPIFSIYALLDGANGHFGDYSAIITKTISQSSSQCVLFFNYYCDLFNCPLEVVKQWTDGEGFHQNVLWNSLESELTLNRSPKWRIGKVFIGRDESYKLTIGSYRKYNSNYVIGVNDIDFAYCSPPKFVTSQHECALNEYMCKDNGCIGIDLICDYQNDCMDGEDESDCESYVGRCTFEQPNSCLLWHHEFTNRLTFKLESGSSGLYYLPKTDHTSRSRSSYFMSFHINTDSSIALSNDSYPKTRYVSKVFNGSKSIKCRLRFWWNVIGEGCSLNIYRRFNYRNGSDLLHSFIDSNDFWNKADLAVNDVNSPKSFQVVIEAVISKTSLCSVNFDDISLTPNCYATDDELKGTPPTPPPQINKCTPKYQCKNGNCYSHNQRCNFIKDCGDNDDTDELNCESKCDFEKGLCGWFTPTDFIGLWQRQQGSSPSLRLKGSGPVSDHTYKNASGFYAVTTKLNKPSDKTQLHSPYYTVSGPNCRFKFYYYMSGERIGVLNLYLKSNSHLINITKLWSKSGQQANKWMNDSVYIGKQKDGFGLIFEAVRDKTINADFGLDDIQFVKCRPDIELAECTESEWKCNDLQQCIPVWKLCDGVIDCKDKSDENENCTQTKGNCWFTNENWKTICNWIDIPMDFNWTFGRTKSNKTLTGPQTPLNNISNYIYINSGAHLFGQRASVAGPEFSPSRGSCHLSFYYYMWGSSALGELMVYTKGRNGSIVNAFHMSGNRGAKWNYAHLLVGNQQPYRVIFEGIVGGDNYTDIAIDFVSFSDNCMSGSAIPRPKNTTGCKSDQFNCPTIVECIPIDWVCDCKIDCKDSSDELNCDKNCTQLIKHELNTNKDKNKTKVAYVISGSVVGGLIIIAIFATLVYVKRKRESSSDRSPLTLENNIYLSTSPFETTSHRELDSTVTFELSPKQTKNEE